MNFEIFNAPDPSGRFSKESFISKNYPEEYEYIIEYGKINHLEDLPFKERVYLCLNNMKKVPICKNPNCDKVVGFKNSTLGYREYCSNKCISSDPNIKKLKEEKSYEKFGTKAPAQSAEVKNKILKTNLEKWGGGSPMCDEKIRAKSKETLMKNWGVDNPNKSKEIAKRRIESFKKGKYKETFKKTSLERYGVEHPWMSPSVHKKTIDFFYSNYRKRIESKLSVDFKFIDFDKDMSTRLKFHCIQCNSEFLILPYQFYYRINSNLNICTNCYPISENSSLTQIEVFNFIKENYEGVIITNCKDAIRPYEIDIYLPESKIGFEYNGVWWHSEKFKNEKHHLNKINSCEGNGIKLVTIWEDDWLTKNEIVKSFIKNKLNKTSNRIFARKCVVMEIDYNSSKSFLEENHLQGDCKSSIRVGLFYEQKLVCLMTFSKLRLPLQKSKEKRSHQDTYELTRFCNKIETGVIGGASRILKYFIDKYKPERIETYSDNLISDGNLYEKLGFEYVHTSKPGYWYVVDGIRQHRFNWRKQKLIKMGHSPDKTEQEIMNEIGYFRIHNAGNKKWVFTPQKNSESSQDCLL